MKTCLFCSKRADSREHVLPQWLLRCCDPEKKGIFPVTVGRYVAGKGYRDTRNQISLAFKARIVCEQCNCGWMATLESKVDHILKPLIGKEFPILSHCHLEELRTDASLIALWLAKTALTTSFALPSKQRLPDVLARHIAQQQVPPGIRVDVAKAGKAGIAAALIKVFRTVNGGVYRGFQAHEAGACFQFCLQINHLLLRVAMAPQAEICYARPDGQNGLRPFRLFPKPDQEVPEHFEFQDVNWFLHSVFLKTWLGCSGEFKL